MKILKPEIEIVNTEEELRNMPILIENFGRISHKSQDKITNTSHEKFCKMLIRRGHESVLEHCSITVRIICDRATSHQIVRHRLCSFTQESQRYINYQDDVLFILPNFKNEKTNSRILWLRSVEIAEKTYRELIELGESPEEARSVLPNSTAVEMFMTANVRQWRHVFRERALNPRAQKQIRELFMNMLHKLILIVPSLFEDLLMSQ